MPSGTPDFAAGWDPSELKRCVRCQRSMRHRSCSLGDKPNTVQHRGEGKCASCQRLGQTNRKQADPEGDAARLRMALKVQAEIRARRQRLGISPTGRVLPRRVDAG